MLYFSESSIQQQVWSPYLCGQASSPCFFFVMAAPWHKAEMKQTFGKYEVMFRGDLRYPQAFMPDLMGAPSKIAAVFQVLLCSEPSFIHSSKGNKIQMFMEGQWLMELLSCFSAVPFHTTLCLSWLDLPMYQRGHLLDCGCLHQAALNPGEFQFSIQWPQREHSASLLVKPKSVMLNTTVQLSYQDISMKTNIRVPCGINKRCIVHVC